MAFLIGADAVQDRCVDRLPVEEAEMTVTRSTWLVLASLTLLIAAGGCADKVALTDHPCPCATGNVCCPSGVCAPDQASCAATTGVPPAPGALTFTRQSQSMGAFSWDAVPSATSYALFVNGKQVQTTPQTTATLDIGGGDVEVRVAALNDSGSSPVSSPFPVLFDISVRACASDTIEARWSSGRETDTQLSIERAGENTIACTDPTLRTAHVYGDAAGCTQTRLPMGTGGRLEAGSTMTVNLLSRDELGFLGKYKQSYTMPPVACVCATSSRATDDSGCNPVSSNPMDPTAPGFDLENGTLVTDPGQADVYMRGTEIGTGALTEAWLVAPNGVALLADHMLCDVLEAPASGYTTEILIHTADALGTHELLPERSTAFVVKTRNGRYAKLDLDFNGPGGFLNGGGNGIGALGMRFAWRLAPAGSTTFAD
jgi:hypothetical protein